MTSNFSTIANDQTYIAFAAYIETEFGSPGKWRRVAGLMFLRSSWTSKLREMKVLRGWVIKQFSHLLRRRSLKSHVVVPVQWKFPGSKRPAKCGHIPEDLYLQECCCQTRKPKFKYIHKSPRVPLHMSNSMNSMPEALHAVCESESCFTILLNRVSKNNKIYSVFTNEWCSFKS